MNPRKILRKPLASFLKRYYMLTAGGFSVGSAYGARFLFDWRHSLDKKVALELYEYDQITYLTQALDRIRPTSSSISARMPPSIPSLRKHGCLIWKYTPSNRTGPTSASSTPTCSSIVCRRRSRYTSMAFQIRSAAFPSTLRKKPAAVVHAAFPAAATSRSRSNGWMTC
jgi:hypothetical protein